ncbi:MAG: hypothetical protein ACOY5Y_06920 [Pseudomonadota bacterium]
MRAAEPQTQPSFREIRDLALALVAASLIAVLLVVLHLASNLKGTIMLSGKKTYLVALGVVAVAVGQFLTGDAALAEAVNQALVGLGLATLRAGVAKAE